MQFVEFLPDYSVQLFLIERRHRNRLPSQQGLERTQLDRQRAHRSGSHTFRVSLEAGDVVEIPKAIAETEHMHLVLGREVTDLAEGGDFVAAIRREGRAPADKENAHCRAPRA